MIGMRSPEFFNFTFMKTTKLELWTSLWKSDMPPKHQMPNVSVYNLHLKMTRNLRPVKSRGNRAKTKSRLPVGFFSSFFFSAH